jgi:hypothetical protein
MKRKLKAQLLEIESIIDSNGRSDYQELKRGRVNDLADTMVQEVSKNIQ